MSNRAKFAAAIAAAGMLAVVGAPAAEAATVSPSSTVVSFSNVLIGATAQGDVTFTIDPATRFTPNVFDISGAFSYIALTPDNCDDPSCLVTFLFTPSVAGPVTQVVRVVFGFRGGSTFEQSITLNGVGVVPVPAALPLFLTGLGGLAYMSRRRKTAA